MILGLNTDVRHKGKTFHIQTEDSGVQNPVLITHVFIGGTIIHTRKSNYAEELEREDLESHVRALMRTQHRNVHESLKDSAFDDAAKGSKRAESHIPLAKKRGPVGLMSSGTPTPLSPATPAPEPAEAQAAATRPQPDDTEAPSPAESGLVEYATDLLAGRPLSSTAVAWVLENEPPT